MITNSRHKERTPRKERKMKKNLKKKQLIKKKEKELSLGTMVVCTMDIGLTENRKGSVYTSM